MKPCLDDNELLRLWAAEAHESPDERAHLARCPRCTAGFDQLAREAGMITGALTTAADHLRWRERAARPNTYARIGEGLRTAAIFSGAAVFGGAAAFALLVALGWHPARASNRIAKAAGDTLVAETAAGGNPATLASTASAASESGASFPVTRSLYAVDAITSDPLAGFADSDTVPVNSNPAGDLLFCVPEDDGAICSSSAEQG
jgi:hypothetical protein